jgi:hypothetical protein
MTKLIVALLIAFPSGCFFTGSASAGTAIRVGVITHVSAVRPVRVAPYRYPVVAGCGRFGFRSAPVVVVPAGNWGKVDFNVKPKSSKVFVDGTFIGVADQWDGGFFGTTATLKGGTHRVRVEAPDGRSITRKIYVMPGKELNFNLEF